MQSKDCKNGTVFLLFPRVHLSFTFIDTQRLISPVGFCLTCSIVSCIPEGDCSNTSHTNLSISPTSPTPLHADPQAPSSCVSTFHRRLLFDLPLVLFEQNIKEHMHDCVYLPSAVVHVILSFLFGWFTFPNSLTFVFWQQHKSGPVSSLSPCRLTTASCFHVKWTFCSCLTNTMLQSQVFVVYVLHLNPLMPSVSYFRYLSF